MSRSLLVAFSFAVVPLLTARVASGQTPLQVSPYAGAECFQDCEEYGFAAGLNLFWVAGRVGALGLLAEYVDTSADDRTGTWRYGPAFRAYISRSGFLEPYVHFALGAANFVDRSTTCSVEASAFVQFALGLEANIAPKSFVGISISATQQAHGVDCYDDVRARNWDGGPMFGALLTARFGPEME